MKKNYTPDFFIIPAIIMLDKKLQPIDSKVYGLIYWFEQMNKGTCTASNNTLADSIGSSAATIANSISRLRDRGYVTGEYNDKGGREYLLTLIHFVKGSLNNEPPLHQMIKTPSSNDEQNNKIDIYNNTKHIVEIYELYIKHFKALDRTVEQAKNRYKLTPRRRDAIKVRLKDAGFNMLRAAIIGYAHSDWHTGQNDRKWVADLETFICRNYENVEKGANMYEEWLKNGSQKVSGDAWEGL